MQHEPVAPWGLGQTQEQRSDSSRMRGQGWAKDGMGCQSAGWVTWLGRAVAENSPATASWGWDRQLWAGLEFHKDLEINIFIYLYNFTLLSKYSVIWT